MSRYFSGRYWTARYWAARAWSALSTTRRAIRATWQGGPTYRATWSGTMADDTILLNIAEDFLAQADVEAPATTTGTWDDLTGQTTFAFRVALTKTGAAVGSLSGTASERSATAGRYYYTFDKGDLTADLADYVGRTVFVILSQTGNLDCKWWPVLVADSAAGTVP